MLMTDRAKNFIKRHTLLCIVMLFVLMTCVGVVAVYTNLNSIKRVVSTRGGGGVPFSSNYLTLVSGSSDSFDTKRIPFGNEETGKVLEITVCNYVQNNPTFFNANNITYTLTLTLVDLNGNIVTDKDGLVAMDGYSFSDGVCVISGQTLVGKRKSVNTYTLTIPESFKNTVNLKAEAVPDNDSYRYTDNSKLSRLFTFSDYVENVTSWTGDFSETTAEGYDGFNYVISGQGKGKVTVKWDGEKLEMSKIFLDMNSLTPVDTDDGKKSITMEVDSEINGMYTLQFYKTQQGITDNAYGNMTAVKSYVEFSFTENT